MNKNIIKLSAKICSRIIDTDNIDIKIPNEYTREQLSLIKERVKVIRYVLKVRKFNRTYIELRKFQEMIYKLGWTLGVYDLEAAAYELEKYIVSNTLYNDIKDAMIADMKYGNPRVRGTDSLDAIAKLFDNSTNLEEERAIIDSLEPLTTEYIEYPSDDEIEIMTNYRLIGCISNFMYIDGTILDHIKNRLK